MNTLHQTVLKMGNPALREVATPVAIPSIQQSDFQERIDVMIATMRKHQGVGIAAPQLGILQRVFVWEVQDNDRYPDASSFPLHIAINPVIKILDTTSIQSWEGCLSIPNIRGRLERYPHIQLHALDRFGVPYTKELKGFPAIIAQHEMDHLDGILFIDRMKSMETLSFQKEYETFWKM